MPKKKYTKKAAQIYPNPYGFKAPKLCLSSGSPKRVTKKRDQSTIRFQQLLRERKQYILNWPLQTMDQTTFALQSNFDPKFMNAEQKSYIFQFLLHNMGMNSGDWRMDINVTIPIQYLGAVVSSMIFFHQRNPEQIDVVDCNRVAIATPGFDTLYDPSTPKNKVCSPTRLKRITQEIVDMGDENRIALNQGLREEKLELFRWSENGAVPFRPSVPIPKEKKRGRRVTW